MNKHLVFVYGTLRQDGGRGMLSIFPASRFIGRAKVSGSLYDLGAYPGLLVDESNSMVTGEVYEVDEETLNLLDVFEATSNYRRKQVQVSLGEHEERCWIYEPNPDCHSLQTPITSGDWVEYARSKTGWLAGSTSDETQS